MKKVKERKIIEINKQKQTIMGNSTFEKSVRGSSVSFDNSSVKSN